MPFTTRYNEQPTLWMAVGPLILIGIYMLVYVIVMVWNIVQGIKVLR